MAHEVRQPSGRLPTLLSRESLRYLPDNEQKVMHLPPFSSRAPPPRWPRSEKTFHVCDCPNAERHSFYNGSPAIDESNYSTNYATAVSNRRFIADNHYARWPSSRVRPQSGPQKVCFKCWQISSRKCVLIIWALLRQNQEGIAMLKSHFHSKTNLASANYKLLLFMCFNQILLDDFHKFACLIDLIQLLFAISLWSTFGMIRIEIQTIFSWRKSKQKITLVYFCFIVCLFVSIHNRIRQLVCEKRRHLYLITKFLNRGSSQRWKVHFISNKIINCILRYSNLETEEFQITFLKNSISMSS